MNHDRAVAANQWTYPAHVTDAYDGDSITVEVDLGLKVGIEVKLRLLGIDTPELYSEEHDAAIAARDYVRELLLDRWVLVRTHKDKTGKFGRTLVEVFAPLAHGGRVVNLNAHLIATARARRPPYDPDVEFTPASMVIV